MTIETISTYQEFNKYFDFLWNGHPIEEYNPVLWDQFLDLHVHHMHYPKGLKAWECPDSLLITVCEFCHRHTHSGKEIIFFPDKFEENLRKEDRMISD